MTDNEQKAQELYAMAEKKASPNTGFLGKLFGGTTRQEEAAELYVRAANSFKMAKNWRGAGESFRKAAETQQNLGSRHEAASNYVDAANCFKKIDHAKAIEFLHHAIQIYADMGRFTIAAKHHVSIAEIYETESMDIDQSIANYEQAADYYKGEESNSSANKCLLKVALFAAQQEQYEKAIEIYETIATSAMDNQLLRYSAKDYFFRAALCHMCIETANAANAVARYEEMFPTFSDARECKLLKNLLDACEDQNIDAYTDAVKSYDTISRLDQWFTTMLLRIKKSIEGEPNLK